MRHVSWPPQARTQPGPVAGAAGAAGTGAGRARLAWVAAWAAVVPVALTRASSLAEPDTFWQIRAGQVILRTGRIPAADTFSWWARGRPWAPNSWGFDVLLALAYRAGGLTAVALAGSVLVLGVAVAVVLLARALRARPAGAALLAVAAMAAVFGWLSVRPQLADYAAVPVLLLVAAREGVRPRLRGMLAAAGIEAVWVNLHTAAPLGAAVLLCHGLGAQAQAVAALPRGARRRALPSAAARAVALPAAALAGVLASPRGAAVFAQASHVTGASTGLITEWQHASLTSPGQVAVLGAGVLAAALTVRRRRFDLALPLALLAAGGAWVIRVLPVLAIVSAAVLAAALDGPRLRAWAADRRALLRIAAAAAMAALAAQAAAGLPHLGRTIYPVGSVRALPTGCRLFNSYALGGIVILLRPGVPVSLDSRNDLYGRRDVLAQQRILGSASGGAAALRRLGVTCALIPAGSGLARQLTSSPGWRRVTASAAGSVFVRREG